MFFPTLNEFRLFFKLYWMNQKKVAKQETNVEPHSTVSAFCCLHQLLRFEPSRKESFDENSLDDSIPNTIQNIFSHIFISK